MSRLVIKNNLSLDGVMQSPSNPDEDRRGGFEHGGWALRGRALIRHRRVDEYVLVDPPAGARLGAPALPRWLPVREASARGQRDHHTGVVIGTFEAGS